ncbi:MAG: EAL domain-containing protein [Actinobacteria bacterium]|nr:EAL domain-containing protein [Actinomycetota bacterium]
MDDVRSGHDAALDRANRALWDLSPDMLAVARLDGAFVAVDAAWSLVLGYSADELTSRPFCEFVVPADRSSVDEAVVSLGIRGHGVATLDCQVKCADGGLRHLVLVWKLADDGAEAYVLGRDVTDLKTVERERNRAARYSRSLIEASLDPLVTISALGIIMDVNAATEEVTGVPRDTLIGSDFSSYFTEPDQARAGYQLVFSQGTVTDYPLAIHHTSGAITDVLYNATVYTDENGDVAGVFAAARDITDLKRAEGEIVRAARYSRSLLEASLDPLVTISALGIIMDVNAATETVTGVHRDTLIGSDFSSYFTEPDQARAGYQLVFSQGHVTDYPLAIRHTSGTITDVLYNATVYTDENGDVAGVFAAARDITDLKNAQTALAAEAQLRLGMDNSAIGMCIVSREGRFLRVNRILCGILERSAEELECLSWADVTHPDDVASGSELVVGLLTRQRASFRTRKRYLAPDGRVIWAEVSVGVLPQADGSVSQFLAQVVDITEQVTAESELVNLATHDPLTGLANRAALRDEITRALSAASRSGRLTAVLMIDLDRFKNVNDSLGHTVGDELLRAAAGRIEASVRGGDLVARPGGDEFVIVMRDLDSPSEAVRAAWRIVTDLRAPFKTTGTELSATASIGVALAGEASGADDLLREADTAMYLAKREGRDRVTVFNEELRVAASFRLATETHLRHALAENQLEVWYQPEVNLATGTLIAVEALLRWRHPDGEIYTADRFIDIAEETGIILDIGDWVIRSACTQAAAWQAARPDRPLTVRFNLSTLQVAEDGLLEAIDEAISASGADPRRLCVEITETALLRETATAHTNLVGIRQRGISIAIDDFGTGYASLAYLRDYPVDVLKIDRSFVADITISDQSRRIVTGIIALSDALGISVTAEGVEDHEQAIMLRDVGCPAAQGYLYSKAVPAEDISPLLDTTFPHP